MEINKIEKSNIIAFKPRKSPATTKPEHGNFQTCPVQSRMPNNPKYYQALNKINFPNQYIAYPFFDEKNKLEALRLHVLFDDEAIALDFDKNNGATLFAKNGELDEESVDFFLENFRSFYKIRKEKYEKESEILINILNEKNNNNIRVLNPKDELRRAFIANEDTQSENYAEFLLNDLKDTETKKSLAAMYLNRIERESKNNSKTTTKEALRILQLSKNEDGSIDKDNLDKKIEIAILSTTYDEITQQNNFSAIYKSSQDEKGLLDLDFMVAMCQLLNAGTNGEAALYEIEIARNIVLKYRDKENFEELIAQQIKKMNNFEISLFGLL